MSGSLPHDPNQAQDFNNRGLRDIVSRLTPAHYRIMDLHLANVPFPEIGKEVNLTRMQVSNIVNSPVFQHELSVRRSSIQTESDESLIRGQDAVQKALRDSTILAVERLIGLLDPAVPDSVARQAANDILDRGGYPKITRQDVSSAQTISIDADVCQRLEAVLAESRSQDTKQAGSDQKAVVEGPLQGTSDPVSLLPPLPDDPEDTISGIEAEKPLGAL